MRSPSCDERSASAETQRRRRRRPHKDFFRCAALVLPYLTPTELASVSLTCKTLRQISKSITLGRISNSSRGFETVPTPFLNPTAKANAHPYSYFLYTPTQTLPVSPDTRQSWGSSDGPRVEGRPDPFLFRVEGAIGCDCETCRSGDGCPCSGECGPSCKCGSGCENRASQGGITARLKIVRDERKGWGLYAAQSIPCGRFVCEYAGELLSTKEARRRQQMYDKQRHSAAATASSLLVVKEHLPSGTACMRINIDATRTGNVSRYINHSCDGGNLDTVILRSSGALLPRICFFTSRDVGEDEELSFSYGDVSLNPNGQPCLCGSAACTGILPSEHT
ncbi:histone-lysine N-methyltransferase SUVR3 [Andrographis paniculata]|uniref:histone-lysine N-methyltransferase SUVR3 n=1 Tax=Andrographis paniculata TaxID=175694 RepID=UPI0021E766E6|nr:histone-lysine N-methyltransferase SUVR3 [Andrographis paniculata]